MNLTFFIFLLAFLSLAMMHRRPIGIVPHGEDVALLDMKLAVGLRKVGESPWLRRSPKIFDLLIAAPKQMLSAAPFCLPCHPAALGKCSAFASNP